MKTATAKIEALTHENSSLKEALTEKDKQKGLPQGESEALKQRMSAKEKECEILKHDLQAHQQELSLMKAHLNKILEENSHFREDYLRFVFFPIFSQKSGFN